MNNTVIYFHDLLVLIGKGMIIDDCEKNSTNVYWQNGICDMKILSR